ncbi:condensation domain-containing protein [Williamsia deligens]|uniref:Condensation domain-containing protein n=1 Tax=Williamsia deligens TaxID=321325 RepID=A0ABW3G9C9_9NOCA|nr:condensation domain-containing protein [Williamsia deligens]
MDLSDARVIVSDIPPSFNQRFHLESARARPGDETVFLAAAFDVDGALDHDALARAFAALVDRHDSLRCGFTVEPSSDEGAQSNDEDAPSNDENAPPRVVRRIHDRSRMRLVADAPIETSTPEEAHLALRAVLSDSCAPLGDPDHLFAAIDGHDTSTIVCAFDHAHVDAWSIAVVVDDLRLLYDGFRRSPESDVADRLGPVGSFLRHCAAEARDDRDHAGHPAMDGWRTFFARHDNMPPSFPADLGLLPGHSAPQAVDLRTLADAPAADRLDAACRSLGASTFAGILAAMAHAARQAGLADDLSLLFPMHTRRSPLWDRAVGWFTTNAPITVTPREELCATVSATGDDLRAAVRLGAIPVPAVVAAIGGLTFVRSDVFMVSFVDYRRLPGAGSTDDGAHHISNITRADDVQVWISRTDAGLALRTRFPDTPTAHRVVGDFLDTVVAVAARITTTALPRALG